MYPYTFIFIARYYEEVTLNIQNKENVPFDTLSFQASKSQYLRAAFLCPNKGKGDYRTKDSFDSLQLFLGQAYNQLAIICGNIVSHESNILYLQSLYFYFKR